MKRLGNRCVKASGFLLLVLLGFAKTAATQGQVALTFDDGPRPFFVPAALQILARFGARATFFVVGRQLEVYPQLAAQIVAQGHEVENHTYDHFALTDLAPGEIRAQISHTNALIAAQTGVTPRYLRPPYGAVNEQVREVATDLGVVLLRWTVDPQDWRSGRTAEAIVQQVLHQVTDGSIVLLHEKQITLQALPDLIRGLQAAGYTLVTVRELLGQESLPSEAPPSPPRPAKPPPPQRLIALQCGFDETDAAKLAPNCSYRLLVGERFKRPGPNETQRPIWAWRGETEVCFQLLLPPETIGRLRLLLSRVPGRQRAQELIVNHRYEGKFRGERWIDLPLLPADTARGVVEVQLLGIGGPAAVAKVILEAHP
ncbi:MAG TPA: polysaccharide deacetylase family protein [Armatimonadetes bacterium]|nr:polysaccharide deacetylase family protein [Armatimonadota bacterium]